MKKLMSKTKNKSAVKTVVGGALLMAAAGTAAYGVAPFFSDGNIFNAASTRGNDGSSRSGGKVINTNQTPWATEAISLGEGEGVISMGVVVDRKNRIHAAINQDVGGFTYRYSDDGGTTWTEVDFDAKFGSQPNLAVGPDDSVHIAWLDKRNGTKSRVYYSYSNDRGASWSSHKDLSGDLGATALPPTISSDTRGRVHVAWNIGDPGDGVTTDAKVYYARSTDGGANFSSPTRLNTSSTNAAWPRMTIAHGDIVAIPWRQQDSTGDWDIWGAFSTDGGATFVERQITDEANQNSMDPVFFVDSRGTIHLGYSLYGTDTGASVMYSQSTDKGVTWTSPVEVSTYMSEFAFFASSYGKRALWLMWKDERDAPARKPGEITSADGEHGNKQADLVGRVSRDGGKTWSEEERVTDRGETEVMLPSFAVGANGIPVTVWGEVDSNGIEQVYFTKRAEF